MFNKKQNLQSNDVVEDTPKARVITVSDRCSQGSREDKSGPLAKQLLGLFGFEVDRVEVVPDGIETVQAAVRRAVADGVRVLFTTGGTGVSPRDLTPEACAPLLALRLEGMEQAAMLAGLKQTPAACLSRLQVGLTSRDAKAMVVINAPGSPGAVRDTLNAIGPFLGHLLGQLAGRDHDS